MEIRASTRLIALLGDPVTHSLSPALQNAAFHAAGVDAVYLALRVPRAGLEGLLRGVAAAGGAGNLTVPHKTAGARLVEVRTAAVDRTGACNTFWAEAGRLHGDNTDVEGFAAAARSLIGAPAGARALVLGAGGAARAAVAALIDARADQVHVLNRSPEPARALRDALDPGSRRVQVIENSAALRREGYDVVVNATPVGLTDDDPLPLDLEWPARVGAVLDLVYRSGGTPWVRAAREAGLTAADGQEMLLYQGAAGFRRWFGREPDLDVMRRALPG